MTNFSPRTTSCLFTVRLWAEEFDRHLEWRGQIQLVSTGETHYFRDWQTLVAHLMHMLPALNAYDRDGS